jgi:hypothetical protein
LEAAIKQRNENRDRKHYSAWEKIFLGCKGRPAREAEKLTAICERIV